MMSTLYAVFTYTKWETIQSLNKLILYFQSLSRKTALTVIHKRKQRDMMTTHCIAWYPLWALVRYKIELTQNSFLDQNLKKIVAITCEHYTAGL